MGETLSNYRVAVTGANGFLGAAVVKEFLLLGASVSMLTTSVLELAHAVLQLVEKPVSMTKRANRSRPGRSDIFRLVADNARAVRELSWKPEINLEDGLRSLLEVL